MVIISIRLPFLRDSVNQLQEGISLIYNLSLFIVFKPRFLHKQTAHKH